METWEFWGGEKKQLLNIKAFFTSNEDCFSHDSLKHHFAKRKWKHFSHLTHMTIKRKLYFFFFIYKQSALSVLIGGEKAAFCNCFLLKFFYKISFPFLAKLQWKPS